MSKKIIAPNIRRGWRDNLKSVGSAIDPLTSIVLIVPSLIVKPDASPEEVRAVVNDEGGGQIFAQAVCPGSKTLTTVVLLPLLTADELQ